jgi:signal transduction histidine kinase
VTLSLRQPPLRVGALAVLLAVVSLAALAAGLVAVDRIGEEVIGARQMLVIQTARDYFVSFAHEEGLIPLARALDRHERHPYGAFRYALFSSDGRRLGGANLLRAEQVPEPGVTSVTVGKGRGARAYEVLVQPLSIGGELVIYEDLGERFAFRRAVVLASGAALLVGLLAVSTASLWLNGLLLRRAAGIADAAGRIAGGDLSARAPVGAGGDVFDRLAMSLNAMLIRIEELMTGLKTVTDSLAHDLRSPLTRMEGSLSKALDPALGEAARLEAIEQAHAEAEGALATFSALTDIARAEAGVSLESMTEVELTRLLADLAELFAPVFEDQAQTLEPPPPHPPVTITAHEPLLRQALGNLLHNAARYAGAGAIVSLGLDVEPGLVRLIVADNGPGVPDDQRGRVQERFVRLDSARHTPGSGLGLAIAAACAKLHRGRLILEDNRPGLRAVLELSRRPAAEPAA